MRRISKDLTRRRQRRPIESLESRLLLAAVSWDAGAGDNLWNSPNNWSNNQVPTPADDVTIDLAGTYTIHLQTTAASVNSLSLGGASGSQTLAITADLTLAAASAVNANGVFQLVSGDLGGAGDLTVNGTLNWTSQAAMSGSGKTIIASGGALNITGGQVRALSRVVDNNGTTTVDGSPTVQFVNATFNNFNQFVVAPTAVVQPVLLNTAGTNTFNNTGTFNQNSVNASFISQVPFNNGATVNINSSGAGALELRGGGTNTGTLNVNDGVLQFQTTSYTHGAASLITGPGTVTFSGATHVFPSGTFDPSGDVNFTLGTITINNAFTPTAVTIGGSVTFNTAQSFADVSLTNGAMTGPGDITITNVLNWTAGAMSGSGKTIVDAGAALNLTGSQHTLSRQLDSEGTVTWNGSLSLSFNNGTFNNAGTFTVGPDIFGNSTDFIDTAGTNAFNNSGTFNQNSDAGLFTSSVPFNNSATVNADSPGGIDLEGGGTNSGTINVNQGLLRFETTYTHAVTSLITGAGTVTFNGGTHSFPAGTFTPTGPVNFSVGMVTINNAITPTILTINGVTASAVFNAQQTFSSANLSAGTLAGSSDVTISGTLNWSGGTMGGSARTIIDPGATLNLSGSSARNLNRRLDNNGTVTWNGSFPLVFHDGTLNNFAQFNVGPQAAGNTDFADSSGTNAFNNSGTFTQNSAADLFTSGVPFNNSATVTVNSSGAGGLEISGGGTNTGTINVTDGLLRFETTSYTHGATSSITGPGTVTFGGGTHNLPAGTFSPTGNVNFTLGTVTINNSFTAVSLVSGGTVNFNAAQSFSSLTMTGGTLSGSGIATVSSALAWSGGTMSGMGTTIIDSGATATLTTTTTKTLNRVLELDGTLILEATAGLNGTGSIVNSSTVKKTVAGTSTISGVTLLNAEGVIHIAAGTLDLNGPFQSPAGKITTVRGPGTLNMDGTQDWGSGSRMDVDDGATVNLNRDVGALNRPELRIIFGTVNINTTQHFGPYEAISIQNEAIAVDGSSNMIVKPGSNVRVVAEAVNLDVADGAKLDLNDGVLIVDYPAADPSPFATIRGYVLAGLSNVAGIVSTSVANDPSGRHVLGYAEASTTGLTSIAGEPIDSTAVIVRYVYAGDTNLDGTVDITDLGRLASNWQMPGDWSSGNFNYDGFVNITDLGMLATNWQRTLPAPAIDRRAPSSTLIRRFTPMPLDQQPPVL